MSLVAGAAGANDGSPAIADSLKLSDPSILSKLGMIQ